MGLPSGWGLCFLALQVHAASFRPGAANRSDSCMTRARAPSISARSPSTPATISVSAAATGSRSARPTSRIGIEQDVAGERQVAADHDALGVDDVAEVRDGDAQRAPRVADQPPGRRVALGRELEHAPGRDLLAAALRQEVCHGPGRGERLEAAAVAAAADGAVLGRRPCGRSRPRCRPRRGRGDRRR